MDIVNRRAAEHFVEAERQARLGNPSLATANSLLSIAASLAVQNYATRADFRTFVLQHDADACVQFAEDIAEDRAVDARMWP